MPITFDPTIFLKAFWLLMKLCYDASQNKYLNSSNIIPIILFSYHRLLFPFYLSF